MCLQGTVYFLNEIIFQEHVLLPHPLSYSTLCPVFIRYPEQLGCRTRWCVSAQVPVISASPWFPSKPLVMAALAPAVAACAHHRLPAQ